MAEFRLEKEPGTRGAENPVMRGKRIDPGMSDKSERTPFPGVQREVETGKVKPVPALERNVFFPFQTDPFALKFLQKNSILCVTTITKQPNDMPLSLMMSTPRPVPVPARLFLFLATVFLGPTVVLTSCTTVNTDGEILKVNPYHLYPGSSPQTNQEMIDFEYRRKVYGAVHSRDYAERYGNYFTVHWRTARCDLPVTIRLQYRQAKTGPKIFAEEQIVETPTQTNTTNFEIIGDDYFSRGAVTQWKATIVQDGAVVDEFKSFLWQ